MYIETQLPVHVKQKKFFHTNSKSKYQITSM